jgi:hypothetical protein
MYDVVKHEIKLIYERMLYGLEEEEILSLYIQVPMCYYFRTHLIIDIGSVGHWKIIPCLLEMHDKTQCIYLLALV